MLHADAGHPVHVEDHTAVVGQLDSRGVTLERLPELAATGADYVSIGALTHSAPSADLSFEIEPA